MLTLSPSQRAMIASEMEARRAMKLADTLQPELRAQAPDLLSAYDKDQAHGTLLDTISKCYAQGIHDENQILNICYIRFIINADVFTNQSFKYLLDNRLMPPYAKARHLILSFFAINAMRGGT